jgi:hypothetical protein
LSKFWGAVQSKAFSLYLSRTTVKKQQHLPSAVSLMTMAIVEILFTGKKIKHRLFEFAQSYSGKSDLGFDIVVLAVDDYCQDTFELIFYILQALVYCIKPGLQPILLLL